MKKSKNYLLAGWAALILTIAGIWPIVDVFHGYYRWVALVGLLVCFIFLALSLINKYREDQVFCSSHQSGS